MEKQPNYQKAQDQAEKVLRENYVLEVPVPIGEVCERYGLTVLLANTNQQENSGVLDFEGKLIYINKLDSNFRQRFTVAHELGHFLMHKELGKKHIERKSPIAGEKPWYEKEADAFAAHLLVPLEFLKQDCCLPLSDISQKYKVSFDVIGYQMNRLK